MEKIALLLITLFSVQAQYTEAITIGDYISYFDASQCAEKLNFTLNDITNVSSNHSAISTGLKCFAACMMEYAGLMRGCLLEDDDSKYNFMEQIPKEWVTEAVQECSANIAELDDHCECGFEMGNCIADNLPEEYIPKM